MDNNFIAVFTRRLKEAKRKYKLAQEAEAKVFQLLSEAGIDPDEIDTAAENADNLEEAITCFLSYDEYSLEGIVGEVRDAYQSKN